MTNTANAAAASNNNEAGGERKFKFAPIFSATITPASIYEGVSKNERPYARMQDALVQRAGKDDMKMTVMAFGNQFAAVQDSLVEGHPVELAVQFDGGSLKIVGFPRAKAEPAAANS